MIFLKSYKKIITAVVALSFVLGLLFPFFEARAFLVHDPAHMAKTIQQTLQEISLWMKDNLMKTLRDVVVRKLIDKMTNDIIVSIQNGGSPRFVTDWKGYLQESGDIAFDEINNRLMQEGIDFCSPLLPQMQMDIVNYTLNQNYFPVRCRLDDVKRNLLNTADAIRRGNWVAYEYSFLPENNPFGMSMIVSDYYYTRAQQEKEARQNEALSSSGYLGTKECAAFKNGVSSGDADAFATSRCKNIATSGAVNSRPYFDCIEKAKADFIQSNCARWSTGTPGDLIAQAATKSIDGKFEYIANVQSIVSALVNVMIDKIINKGFTSITGGGNDGGSYSSDVSEVSTESDVNKLFYKDRIDNAKKDYQSVIAYLENINLLINDSLELINTKFSSCQSFSVQIDEGGGQIKTYTISQLKKTLSDLKYYFDDIVLIDAQMNLDEINDLDYSSSNFGSLAVAIIDKYSSFSDSYQMIVSDATGLNGGTGGETLVYVSGVKNKLINSSCSGS